MKNNENYYCLDLSQEQNRFIKEALSGNNILVDACIGSGKTTAIQHLCNALPGDKNILYLTYNKLLKLDAKSKIKNRNATVSNYHGFAYSCLIQRNIRCGISDIIQTFNRIKPDMKHYDVLMIDEYQDIEQELADMLLIVKEKNPGIQIIAVGDMEQKVYDKTTLNVEQFIDDYLETYKTLEFTQCFRLSADHAAMLGRIWNKSIIGVNPTCDVCTMEYEDALDFLKDQNPKDVLCLGSRQGKLSKALNYLEYNYPDVFNKRTIYASIREKDSDGNEPKNDSGIFTTYDSSKGLERKICVVFDFENSYWTIRSRMPQQKYEILRNIFCVAASRGKDKIVFVKGAEALLDEYTLSTPTESRNSFDNMIVSQMYDFKYKEDVESCFKCLDINAVNTDISEIKIKTTDELIDISPCIGIYQESSYFKNYKLEDDFYLYYSANKDKYKRYEKPFFISGIQKKICILTAMDTDQDRYVEQVDVPFVSEQDTDIIHERLGKLFSPNEKHVQVSCEIPFRSRYITVKGKRELASEFCVLGNADVVKGDTVYELKFVNELRHEHFLQCATYMVGLADKGIKKGILWNVRTNQMYEITIKNTRKFLDLMAKTITKGFMESYW